MVRLSRVTSALLCRYGLRVCGLVEYEGPFDMDIAPEGVQAVCHVLCCAVLCCAVLCCAVLCCAVHARHNSNWHDRRPNSETTSRRTSTLPRSFAVRFFGRHTRFVAGRRVYDIGVMMVLLTSALLYQASVVADVIGARVVVDEAITEWLDPSLVGRDEPYTPKTARCVQLRVSHLVLRLSVA